MASHQSRNKDIQFKLKATLSQTHLDKNSWLPLRILRSRKPDFSPGASVGALARAKRGKGGEVRGGWGRGSRKAGSFFPIILVPISWMLFFCVFLCFFLSFWAHFWSRFGHFFFIFGCFFFASIWHSVLREFVVVI